MNHYKKLFKNMKGWLPFVMLGAVMPVTAAPDAPVVAVQQVPRSVFNLPANPKQGRDPFFPSSFRPYESDVVPSANATSDLSSLAIQGVSGAPPHQLVIINNVTFAAGDDAEVRTPEGRIRIHCVGINGTSAVIEVNGHIQTLHYGEGDKP
jgi:hypothetical protein